MNSGHITPILFDTLHWLPVTQCIEYKIALMTYSCVHAYFHGMSSSHIHRGPCDAEVSQLQRNC